MTRQLRYSVSNETAAYRPAGQFEDFCYHNHVFHRATNPVQLTHPQRPSAGWGAIFVFCSFHLPVENIDYKQLSIT